MKRVMLQVSCLVAFPAANRSPLRREMLLFKATGFVIRTGRRRETGSIRLCEGALARRCDPPARRAQGGEAARRRAEPDRHPEHAALQPLAAGRYQRPAARGWGDRK